MSEFQDEANVVALRRAWERAAVDLGIRVVTESAHVLDADGQPVPLVAFLPDFGGGMHIFERYDAALGDLVSERESGYTVLGRGYDHYDKDVFVEALCDWGWSGEGPPPAWCAERSDDD